jgi:HAD superfamily hydrolase (TIGR01459 family)
MSFLDTLDPKYRAIFCDIWGVVHDGVRLYPEAAERLREWREQGRTVILITNAPRTAESVSRQLDRIGLPRDCWDAITASGEAGIGAVTNPVRPVGFLGTEADRVILEARGVHIVAEDEAGEVVCTGLDSHRPQVEQYRDQLHCWAERNVLMHCFNSDRVVVRGGALEPCAGALADMYEGMGGAVEWYGKPHHAIYDHALKLAGNPPRSQVLAVGDGLLTDVLGAALNGFDCIFVSGGISEGKPFPADFASRQGLADWAPIATVAGLG